VVTMAAAISTPTFAAKKAAAPPAPAKCTLHTSMRTCKDAVCSISWCGHDGKWYPTPFMCWEPFCWAPK
jgi:hypothetical protein